MSPQYREAPRHFLLCTLRLQWPVAAASEVLIQFRSVQEFDDCSFALSCARSHGATLGPRTDLI